MKRAGRLTGADRAAVENFLGLPAPAVRRRRHPRKLGGLVEAWLPATEAGGEAGPTGTLLAAWEDLLGPERSRRCHPVRLRPDGVLVVAVSNPVLRQELSWEKRNLLAAIQALPGCAGVRRLLLRSG
jgi:hypothetical protein